MSLDPGVRRARAGHLPGSSSPPGWPMSRASGAGPRGGSPNGGRLEAEPNARHEPAQFPVARADPHGPGPGRGAHDQGDESRSHRCAGVLGRLHHGRPGRLLRPALEAGDHPRQAAGSPGGQAAGVRSPDLSGGAEPGPGLDDLHHPLPGVRRDGPAGHRQRRGHDHSGRRHRQVEDGLPGGGHLLSHPRPAARLLALRLDPQGDLPPLHPAQPALQFLLGHGRAAALGCRHPRHLERHLLFPRLLEGGGTKHPGRRRPPHRAQGFRRTLNVPQVSPRRPVLGIPCRDARDARWSVVRVPTWGVPMIRKYLLAGLFTLLPLVVTLWILRGIFTALVGIFRDPLTFLAHLIHVPDPPTWALALFSALATVLLLLLVGALMGNFIGRQLLSWLDELMMSLPVVKTVYGATRQLMGAIQSGRGGSFKEVVAVEWPHPGSYTLGFVASRDCSWAIPGGQGMLAVYIPTAPNPTSGYVIMIEASKVRPADLSADQALTWAISGGVVVPPRTGTGSFRLPEKP